VSEKDSRPICGQKVEWITFYPTILHSFECVLNRGHYGPHRERLSYQLTATPPNPTAPDSGE